MPLTTDVYELLYEGLRDGWLCLDDLGPDLAGLQAWLVLPEPCPLHNDPRSPCRNVAVRELDAPGVVTRYRHCVPDGPDPGDAHKVVAVKVLWSDGSAEVLGPAHAAYFHASWRATPPMTQRRPPAPRLFCSPGDDSPARGPNAYRVTAPGGRLIARTQNLTFAVAQARALALRGYAAWLRDDDGNCVEVARTPTGLTATSTTNPMWLGACQACCRPRLNPQGDNRIPGPSHRHRPSRPRQPPPAGSATFPTSWPPSP